MNIGSTAFPLPTVNRVLIITAIDMQLAEKEDILLKCFVIVQIFYLDNSKEPLLQRHISGLPALYLDCDKDIDMERDVAAKNFYVKQIMDFSDHMRKIREAR